MQSEKSIPRCSPDVLLLWQSTKRTILNVEEFSVKGNEITDHGFGFRWLYVDNKRRWFTSWRWTQKNRNTLTDPDDLIEFEVPKCFFFFWFGNNKNRQTEAYLDQNQGIKWMKFHACMVIFRSLLLGLQSSFHNGLQIHSLHRLKLQMPHKNATLPQPSDFCCLFATNNN